MFALLLLDTSAPSPLLVVHRRDKKKQRRLQVEVYTSPLGASSFIFFSSSLGPLVLLPCFSLGREHARGL